jgi:hypothetical protein
MNFFRYLIINGVQRWGSFMWLGTHVSMTQTDWHWMLESGLCIGLDLIMIIAVYLEWHDEHKKKKI